MRTSILGLTLAIAFACACSTAMAEERRGDQCLSGICLGDSIATLPDIKWLPLSEEVAVLPRPPEGFPSYRAISSPGSEALARSIQDALLHAQLSSSFPPVASSRVDRVDAMLSEAHGLSEANREAFRKEARDVGVGIALSPEGIPGLSRMSGVTFCSNVGFLAYFRSESGHPTTVHFALVRGPDGVDTFIVDGIVRLIPVDTRAMDLLFAEVQKEHPSIVHDRDMTTKCESKLGCSWEIMRWPGNSEHPSNWTAAERARSQGKDYFIRFEPRYDDHVQISFQLFPANDEEMKKTFASFGERLEPIPSRLEDRPRPAVCEPPPTEVPSIE
jgi:hypothetical protein